MAAVDAPAWARRLEIAAPMPRVPPVIRHVLSLRSMGTMVSVYPTKNLSFSVV